MSINKYLRTPVHCRIFEFEHNGTIAVIQELHESFSTQVYNESFVFEIPANLAADSGAGGEGGLASLGLELQVLDWDRCAMFIATLICLAFCLSASSS